MKKLYSLFTLAMLVCSATTTQAQQVKFYRSYDNAANEDFLGGNKCADGGYIVCGRTTNNSMDAYLLRLNAFGDTLWTRSYSSANTDYLTGVTECNDGSFIAVGQVSQPNQAAIILKVDANGNILWQKFYTDAQAIQVRNTPDGGYVVCGALNGVWLLKGKGDAQGTVQWNKRYVNVGLDRAYRFTRTQDGGYILGCETIQVANSHSYQMYAVKTDSLGNFQWGKSFGGDFNDNAWGVEQTADGGYVLGGYTNADANGGQGDFDIMLVKLSPSGVIAWKKIYNNDYSTDDQAYNLIKTADGNLVFGGVTKLNDNADHLFLTKVDTLGAVLWSHTIDDMAGAPNSLIGTADGGLFFTGVVVDGSNRNCYALKTDVSGRGCNPKTAFHLNDVSSIAFFEGGTIANILGPIATNWNLIALSTHTIVGGTVCDYTTALPENTNMPLTVYPNPATNNITITTDNIQAGALQTTICNALGQVVYTANDKAANGLFKKDISVNLPSGIYFLTLQNQQGRITKKIQIVN